MDRSKGFGENPTAGKRPLLYYITDRRQLAGEPLVERIRMLLRLPVAFIQIREKDLADRELFDLTCRAVSLARDTECRILVNGRADIALAAGAHGVHLPSSGLCAPDIGGWLPRGFMVGLSVHSLQEARQAWQDGVDYVLVGHVFPTSSKAALGAPLGLQCLREICASIPIPAFGLGGINPESIQSVMEAGAAGVAGISLFQNEAQLGQLQLGRRSLGT